MPLAAKARAFAIPNSGATHLSHYYYSGRQFKQGKKVGRVQNNHHNMLREYSTRVDTMTV